MERKDSVPAVSQPTCKTTSQLLRGGGYGYGTLELDDFVLFGYGDELGAKLDAELWDRLCERSQRVEWAQHVRLDRGWRGNAGR